MKTKQIVARRWAATALVLAAAASVLGAAAPTEGAPRVRVLTENGGRLSWCGKNDLIAFDRLGAETKGSGFHATEVEKPVHKPCKPAGSARLGFIIFMKTFFAGYPPFCKVLG